MEGPLLILGGALYAIPVINAARELGVKAYTCDFLPDNPAHTYSDGYINASIIDKGAVFEAAKSIKAGGIMAFAADPGVISAAYAAEKLDLPFQGSYASVSTLQDKQHFRTFLSNNGFNCPSLYVYDSAGEAMKHADELSYPMIAKPVDSAGSKGCSRVDSAGSLKAAVEYALEFSRSGRCILEQFLQKEFDSSDSDGFLVDGSFQCISFTAQLFDPNVPNPYTPTAYTMPSSMPKWARDELKAELQRMADLLYLDSGIFNIETLVATNGKAYIMECSPRGGGNRLAEMLRFATSGKTDLVRASVQAALGMEVDCAAESPCEGYWYQQMLYSSHAGSFRGIRYAPGFFEAHVAEEQLWVKRGAHVEAFNSANHAFGSVMLRFESEDELKSYRSKPEAFVFTDIQ